MCVTVRPFLTTLILGSVATKPVRVTYPPWFIPILLRDGDGVPPCWSRRSDGRVSSTVADRGGIRGPRLPRCGQRGRDGPACGQRLRTGSGQGHNVPPPMPVSLAGPSGPSGPPAPGPRPAGPRPAGPPGRPGSAGRSGGDEFGGLGDDVDQGAVAHDRDRQRLAYRLGEH